MKIRNRKSKNEWQNFQLYQCAVTSQSSLSERLVYFTIVICLTNSESNAKEIEHPEKQEIIVSFLIHLVLKFLVTGKIRMNIEVQPK